jgi:hypothetical protein
MSKEVYQTFARTQQAALHQRLASLGPENLELRKLRADLVVAYKIVFGIMSIDTAKYFKLNTDINYLNLHWQTYQLVTSVTNYSVVQ